MKLIRLEEEKNCPHENNTHEARTVSKNTMCLGALGCCFAGTLDDKRIQCIHNEDPKHQRQH